MPAPELIVWQKIREQQLGVKFRRQYVYGSRIVDFFAPTIRLGIEIDGDSHFLDEFERRRELASDAQLASVGILILRFANNDVMQNLNGVLTTISDAVRDRASIPHLNPPPAPQREENHSVLAIAIILSLFLAAPVFAAIVPPECAEGLANVQACGLPALIGVFARVAQFVFGIAGVIALVMFLYGGFKWLTSGGSPEKVKDGQSLVVNTVIALFIIFGAYAGVQFLIGAVRGERAAESGKVFVEGERCKKGEKEGVALRFPSGLKCVADCGDTELADEGYREMAPTPELECIAGITSTPGRECCRPAPR